MGEIMFPTIMKDPPPSSPPIYLYSYLSRTSLTLTFTPPPPIQMKDFRLLSPVRGTDNIRDGEGESSSIVTPPPPPAVKPDDFKI